MASTGMNRVDALLNHAIVKQVTRNENEVVLNRKKMVPEKCAVFRKPYTQLREDANYLKWCQFIYYKPVATKIILNVSEF